MCSTEHRGGTSLAIQASREAGLVSKHGYSSISCSDFHGPIARQSVTLPASMIDGMFTNYTHEAECLILDYARSMIHVAEIDYCLAGSVTVMVSGRLGSVTSVTGRSFDRGSLWKGTCPCPRSVSVFVPDGDPGCILTVTVASV